MTIYKTNIYIKKRKKKKKKNEILVKRNKSKPYGKVELVKFLHLLPLFGDHLFCTLIVFASPQVPQKQSCTCC